MVSRPFRPAGALCAGSSCLFACFAALAGAALVPVAATWTEPAGALTAGYSPGASNILQGDQADFSRSTGGWTAQGALETWVSAPSADGGGALEATAEQSGGFSLWSAGITPRSSSSAGSCSGPIGPATPQELYAAGASVDSPSSGRKAEPVLVFCGADGALLDAVWGQDTAVVSGAWSALAPCVAIAPSGTTGVVMGIAVPSSTVGVQIEVDDAWITASPDATPPLSGPLHTAGNRIVDSRGNTVVLRGAVLYGGQATADPPSFSQTQIAALHSWGANLVRIALGEQMLLPSSCAYDPNYQRDIANVVQWVTSLGMVALLDLHYSNRIDLGTPRLGTCPGPNIEPMADGGAAQFWSLLAGEFGSNPLVAFDLYNEPHDISDATWLNGGTASDEYGNYTATGMQSLYGTVRATATSNLVIVSGNHWGNAVPAQLIDGSNVVYSVHVYTCPSHPPPGCYGSDPYDPDPVLQPWVEVSVSHPMMIGEFGWPTIFDGTFNARAIQFAETYGWSWADFSWAGQPNVPFGIQGSAAGDGTVEPAPSGMPALCAFVYRAWDGTPCSASDPPVPTSAAPGGYRVAASDGGVFSFGDAAFFGSMGGTPINRPVVGMAPTPDGAGYWLVASDGGVFSFGDAAFFGSASGYTGSGPAVSMAATPDGSGYRIAYANGTVLNFGATRTASAAGPLNAPVAAIASTPTSKGFWLAATDGGVFTSGDAGFFGSMGGSPLNRPVVGMAPTPDGAGYWLVASDGGVFSFGDAAFFGSTGGMTLNAPVVAMTSTPDGKGYWLIASDGGVFSFGDAAFFGSTGGMTLNAPVVGGDSG